MTALETFRGHEGTGDAEVDLVVAKVFARDLQEILEDLCSNLLRRDELLSPLAQWDLESDRAVVGDGAITLSDVIGMRFPIDLNTFIFPPDPTVRERERRREGGPSSNESLGIEDCHLWMRFQTIKSIVTDNNFYE